MQIRAFGIPWYQEEDWPELLRLFVDADKLPPTYDSWLAKAEQLVKQVQGQGAIAEKVYLDPAEFSGWCAVRGLDIDADARMTFANEFVARKHRDQS